MVGGMCADLPVVPEDVLAKVLTARMVATLLGDVLVKTKA